MSVRGMTSDIVENWANGVVTAALKDRLPENSVPLARNTQFFNVGPSTATLGTRKGATVQNATILTAPALSQHYLNTQNADVHLLSLNNGYLISLANGTPTTLLTTAFSGAPTAYVSWATFGDRAFAVNGTDKIKTDGTTVTNFGIAQPASGAWSAVAAASGVSLPAGDYRLVITYVNSSTGHEGPQSDPKSVTITAGQRIQVTLPSVATVGDSQVDYARIYLEQSGTRNDFFLVADGTSPAVSTSGWALNAGTTATVYIDSTQAQIDVFRTLSPGVNKHYPPPTGALHMAAKHQRMFVAVGTDLYWSDVGQPEAFDITDNTIPIGEDGEVITGLVALEDILVIFKKNITYALVGSSPTSWEVVEVDKTIGCAAHQSIAQVGNRLFWMSLRGPRSWSGSGGIQDITTEYVGDLFDEQAIDESDLAACVAVANPTENYIGWAITPRGETYNTTIIPYHYTLNRWMSSGWDVVDVKSCAVVNDSTGRGWPMLGDATGFVYQLGTATQDGVPSGQVATGTATGATATTLTDSTQSWTVNAFAGRYVLVYDPDDLTTVQRVKIASNTATQLTVSTFDTTPSVGDHYAIGGILLDLWGAERNGGGGSFYKKRIEFLFAEFNSSVAGEDCTLLVYKDGDTDTPVLTRAVTIGSSSLWGTAVWGTSTWSARGFARTRIPIRTTGHTWQIRVLHLSTGATLDAQRFAVQWLTKTRKMGR